MAHRQRMAQTGTPRRKRWQTRIGQGGRVVLPAELRTELGLRQGDAVVIEAERGRAILRPHAETVRAIQDKYRARWKGKTMSSEAFLAERRAMWGEN